MHKLLKKNIKKIKETFRYTLKITSFQLQNLSYKFLRFLIGK